MHVHQSVNVLHCPWPNQEAFLPLIEVFSRVFWVAGHVGSASSPETAGLV